MSDYQLTFTIETEEEKTLPLDDVKECQEWLDKLVKGVESGELSIEGGGSICITQDEKPTKPRASKSEPPNPTIDDDTLKAIALGMLGVGQ